MTNGPAYRRGMDLQPIRSDALVGVDYDPRRRVLTIAYVSGGTYEYYGVAPSLFMELLRSQPHPWRRVGGRIKAHPFRRLDDG
jgi:KTSC domain